MRYLKKNEVLKPDEEVGTREELLQELDRSLEKAKGLAARICEFESEAAHPLSDSGDSGERHLKEAKAEIAQLSRQLVASEHRSNQLMNLYVATYQLYASQNPEEVQATVAEIAVDLLGAERFAILLREGEDAACRVVLAHGADKRDDLFVEGWYRGGDPLVDSTLEDGVLRLGDPETDSLNKTDDGTTRPAPLAAVPLQVQSNIVGVLVLLKLFDHKPALSSGDREILDLLAAHAASALFAARAYAGATRKLQTLESLIRLARGEG